MKYLCSLKEGTEKAINLAKKKFQYKGMLFPFDIIKMVPNDTLVTFFAYNHNHEKCDTEYFLEEKEGIGEIGEMNIKSSGFYASLSKNPKLWHFLEKEGISDITDLVEYNKIKKDRESDISVKLENVIQNPMTIVDKKKLSYIFSTLYKKMKIKEKNKTKKILKKYISKIDKKSQKKYITRKEEKRKEKKEKYLKELITSINKDMKIPIETKNFDLDEISEKKRINKIKKRGLLKRKRYIEKFPLIKIKKI